MLLTRNIHLNFNRQRDIITRSMSAKFAGIFDRSHREAMGTGRVKRPVCASLKADGIPARPSAERRHDRANCYAFVA